VSAGIAEALVTTAVGLGVAILAVWFYNYFTARVDGLIVDMDETASELVDCILKDARAGGNKTAHNVAGAVTGA
jgi:biopolymer transport protein ExbB/TolQ